MNPSQPSAAAGAILVAGLLVVPAAASAAPALAAPLAPCYTTLPPHGVPSIPISLAGGTAGDQFQIDISDPKAGEGSLGNVEGTFDANGNGAATFADVYTPGGNIAPSPGLTATLSVTDFNSAGDVDTPLGSTLITNRALNLGFSFIGGTKSHDITVSGTQFAGQPVYGFIVHNDKVVRRLSLGTGNVCGYTRRKYVLIPKHTPRGKYMFYASTGPKLTKAGALSAAYTVELI